MKIYHFLPSREFDQHTADLDCKCKPVQETKGDDFWQGIFLGREVFQHNYLTPRSERSAPSANDFAAIADVNWE